MRVMLIRALVLCLCLFGNAYADSGLNWLTSQTQSDGSVARPNDIATPVQSTSESLRAFVSAGVTSSAQVTAGLQYLGSQTYLNTENLSRLIISGVAAGQDVSGSVSNLLANQDATTGGFGELPGYQPTVLDTAFAIEALAAVGNLTSQNSNIAIAFLLSKQAADGSWQDNNNGPSVYLTALTTAAINKFSGVFNVAQIVKNGANWLLSARQSDGLWNEDFLSAETLIALLQTLPVQPAISNGLQTLSGHQLADGSWGDDVYTTALVIRTLGLAAARGASAGNGAVEGHVNVAGSNRPIANATVSIPAFTGFSVQTNSDGYFVISGLPAGNVTLVASATGYGSSSTAAQISAGQTVTANFVLAASALTSSVSVHLFDATTNAAVSGAAVALTGTAAYNASTDSNGNAVFGAIAPGAYNITVSATGYATVQGSFTATGGQPLTMNQPMAKGAGSTAPGSITATIVDGSSNAPVPNARLDLGNGLVAISDSNGSLTLSNVSPGSYTGTVSANGYSTQTYSLIVSGGATNNFGTLSIYQATSTTQPSTVTLLGTAIDGLNNKPVAGATISVDGIAATTTTDATGHFTVTGIPSLTFTVHLAAAGYSSTSYGVTASAYGSVSSTFSLSPTSGGGVTINLQGHVTDADTHAAISGVTLSVVGGSITAVSNSAGSYQLANLTNGHFALLVTAPGYASQTLNINLSATGTYVLDIALQTAADASGLQILSLSTNDSGKGANQAQTFTAQIANTNASSNEGLVVGYVLDASGQQVGKVLPFAPSTRVLQSDFTFAANETKTLQIEWNPMQVVPGTYVLQLDVIKPGSIATANPKGTVLAEQLAYTNVSSSSSIAGTLAFNPPLTQAGGTAPVDLQVLVVNSGNVSLSGTNLTLTITPPGGGNALLTRTAAVTDLDVGGFAYVSFGQWVPTQNGNLGAVVAATSGGIQGQVTGKLYVGDKPQGAFTVTPNNVFIGTQKVHASINASGVDTTVGVASPLVFAIQTAVQNGSQYIANNVPAENNSVHCLRCHVQSQAYFGMASLVNQNVGANPSTTNFLYNTLASVQQDNGALENSWPGGSVTETSLALWGLSQSSDKVGSFATKYRAAKFLQSRAVTSGTKTHWENDEVASPSTPPLNANNRYAWHETFDATTMTVIKGIADVLRTAQNNDISGVNDYSAINQVSAGGAVSGLKAGPDGALYAMLSALGKIVRYDLSTNSVSTVATGLPTNCGGFLVVAANDIYAACPTKFIHVKPDGTIQTMVATGATAADVALGPDGKLYVSDASNNRILSGPPPGPFTVYKSGGLLSGPVGLGFGSDGTLYVANRSGNNILKIAPDTTVSIYSQGLNFQPVGLTIQPDGTLYVGHADYRDSNDSNQLTSSGVLQISSTGASRRLFTLVGLNGLTTLNGQTYMGSSGGVIWKLAGSLINTSQLTAMTTQIIGAVNFYLSEYTDNNTDNMRQAVRLIGLSEAKSFVTDPTMLNQITQATATINTLLRARQNSDGGWGWHPGNVSDAMVSALVGMGLDTLSPPTNDAAVLNNVNFLLNSQMHGQNSNPQHCQNFASGAWCSAGGVMYTSFASTSLVMAYLPEALKRLGGLNVGLYLNLPSNITLTIPNILPTGSLVNSDGTSTFTWKLDGLTAQGKTLTFDLTLADMLNKESRPAASAAYLTSTNSFDGSQVQVDLGIPNVIASDGLSLTLLQTDQARYAANGNVQITAQINNAATANQSGSVTFIIKAADGSVVATLPSVPFTNLASSTTIPVPATWAIGTTLSGDYTVTADLYDSNGALADEKAIGLTVIGSNGVDTGTTAPSPSVSLRVTTDRQIYTTTDRVTIGDLVRNLTVNGVIESASLQVQVVDPTGTIVYTQTLPLGQLSPGYLRQLSNLYVLSAAPQGSYTVNGWVLDGSGSILASSSATYTVTENLAATLKGTETVQSPWVYQGDPQTCTDVVTNNGTQSISNLSVHQVLVNLDTGVLDQEAFVTANLAPGASKTFTRVFTTNGMSLGHHACAIEAQVNGSYKPLANAVFEVRQMPIRVSGSLGLGDKGRVLVLLDNPTPSSPSALCKNGLLDLGLQASFSQPLSSNASVQITLKNGNGQTLDTETAAISTFTGEVNANAGAPVNLTVTALTPQTLILRLASTTGFDGSYRLIVTTPGLTLDTGTVNLGCQTLSAANATVGNVFQVTSLNTSTGANPGAQGESLSLAQQQAWLHALLTQNGWSHDISISKEDFTAKFRRGDYQAYLLYAEYQPLQEQVNKELREAINSGEGLVAAGVPDPNHSIITDVLGVQDSGRQPCPVGVQMNASSAFGSGQISFSQSQPVRLFSLNGATLDGTVLSSCTTGKSNNAITHNLYGKGHSAFVGFDLLAEASANGPGLFRDLILKPLAYVNPPQTPPLAGRVVPLRLDVTNAGIANTTQVKVSTSLGGYIVTADVGTVSGGKLNVTLDLAANETKTINLWVQTPTGGGAVTVTTQLTASVGNTTATPVSITTTINPIVRPSLDQAISDLQAYADSQPKPKSGSSVASNTLKMLQQADKQLSQGNVQTALSQLVQAADQIVKDNTSALMPIRLEIDEAIFQVQKLQ